MAEWLTNMREKHGMTKTALSHLVGVDISTIGKYERGERRPSVKKAKEIAEVLGFDWTMFYSDLTIDELLREPECGDDAEQM